MTLIVGIIDKEKVYIGADSAGVSGLDVSVRKDVKVFTKGEFVIGCTSSFRMIQLIRFSFTPPKRYDDQDVYEYMCTSFVNELRNVFKNGGFARKDNEVESGGFFLVGYKGRLFTIQADYQVAEDSKNYAAVGCAESYALGALDALPENDDPETRILKAMEIGAYRSGGVRPPFIIEHV